MTSWHSSGWTITRAPATGPDRRSGVAAALLVLAAVQGCDLFTDAATRVAYDLEAGAKRLAASREQTLTVEHVPQVKPEGCAGGYTLQMSQQSALLVWCQDSIGGPSRGSYATTYHLNYVSVPQTLIIHKDHGEHARIDLRKDAGAIVVTGVR